MSSTSSPTMRWIMRVKSSTAARTSSGRSWMICLREKARSLRVSSPPRRAASNTSDSCAATGCPGGELARGELAEAEDDGEQVVEVVRHAAGEQADGLHLLRLAQLLLEALPRGRVLHHGDAVEGRAVGVADEANGGLDDDGVAGLGERASSRPARRSSASAATRPCASKASGLHCARSSSVASLPEGLLRREAERALGRLVPVGDDLRRVGGDDRLAHLVEHVGLEGEALDRGLALA